MIEDSLKGTYSGLNPMFDIGIDVLNRKVQKQTADSKSRIKMVKEMSNKIGAKNLKEEIGILAYMRKQGLENQSKNAKVLIQEFLQ